METTEKRGKYHKNIFLKKLNEETKQKTNTREKKLIVMEYIYI